MKILKLRGRAAGTFLAAWVAVGVMLMLMVVAAAGRAQAQETEPPAGTAARPDGAAPKDAAGKDAAKEKDAKPKTVAELIKDSERIDGLFTVYRDRKTGDLRLLLQSDQLNRTYLHFSYVENGVVPAGVFRGMFTRNASVFTIRRYFNRVEFVVQNTAFYVAPDSPLARGAGTNTTHAVVADEKIEAEDDSACSLLINANNLFLRETFGRITPLPDPKRPPHEIYLPGTLDAARTKIRSVRNYPENTDVVVEYVFANDKPYVGGGEEVTDPRLTSVLVQHSLIAAPTEPFASRLDDPRIGYFTDRRTDLGETRDPTPYRDVIFRWRLVKKDPSAAVSEPVKPIVYWIENTTPHELRPIIERAGRLWNEAFLAAGFKDAVVIKTQPDDATWDAGDIRYNVLRWVATPRPIFSGYGPSFTDPRTGEILGADIILEHAAIANVLRQVRAFTAPSAAPALADPAEFFSADGHHPGCCAGLVARNETIFARAALEVFGADSEEKQRFLEEFLHYLVIHEIGHTLGLSHNFRSSQLHSLPDIYDRAKTDPVGLAASVMDYPFVPFAPPGKLQGGFWPARPGPYDIWAITFGYSPALPDPDAEAQRLDAILARSTEPELAFGNDADVMGAPGQALDPRVLRYDLSSDAIGFARDQMLVIETAVPKFAEKLARPNESHQEILNSTLMAINRYRGLAVNTARHIGGVHVSRAMAGQPGATAPLQPVPRAEQERAMQLLREKVFAPEAFAFLRSHLRMLLAERRGWDHEGVTEDPKLHAAVLDVQRAVLDHLLHPVLLARLTDTRAYGNDYTSYQLVRDLTDAIFAADLRGDINTHRQQLQLEFVRRLLQVADLAKENPYDGLAQSAALERLRWLQGELAAPASVNAETAAHRTHLRHRIERGLEGPR